MSRSLFALIICLLLNVYLLYETGDVEDLEEALFEDDNQLTEEAYELSDNSSESKASHSQYTEGGGEGNQKEEEEKKENDNSLQEKPVRRLTREEFDNLNVTLVVSMEKNFHNNTWLLPDEEE